MSSIARYVPFPRLARISMIGLFSLLATASWLVLFGPIMWSSFGKSVRKPWSAHNMQIRPIEAHAVQHQDNDISDLPNIEATTVFKLSEVAFFIQDLPDLSINITSSAKWAPLTLIDTGTEAITLTWMKKKLDYFLTDDVFSSNFLTTVLLITGQDSKELSDETTSFLSSKGCRSLYLLRPGTKSWPEGPYFYSSRGLFAAWRLYADSGETFIAATIPTQNDSTAYVPLTASAYGTHALTIAVPSRLRYKVTTEKPLAGMRVGVKDVLDLKGIRTGNGNRAWAQLYPPSRRSTDFIEQMVHQGAIFVGKTKTVEFAGNQEVVADWVDYSYPFNPRGDYYIGATGSSTGSAAALAMYPWLDVSLGTDGGGSVRDPAISGGIYGFRPTHDGNQEPGAQIPCPSFQTTGYFARSLAEMLTFGRFWLTWKSIRYKKLAVKTILAPPEYDVAFKAVQETVHNFTSALSKHLQAELLQTSIEDLWRSHRPSSISKPFFTYFEKTFIDTLTNDYYTITSDFRKDYEAKFDQKPYVSPPTQWIWSHGSSITPERKKAALEEVNAHNDFFLDHVMHNQDSEASTLIIVPRYYDDHRDDRLPIPNKRGYYGFDSNLHASLSGVPNIVVPIGQAKYLSQITGKTELLPVSASIIGAKDTDLALIEMLLDFLPSYGVSTSVLTGQTAFKI